MDHQTGRRPKDSGSRQAGSPPQGGLERMRTAADGLRTRMLRTLKAAGERVRRLAQRTVPVAARIQQAAEPLTEPVIRRAYVLTIRARRALARHPVSPLLYATLAVLLVGVGTFRSTYVRAYAVTVDGVAVGTVSDTAQFEETVSNVETRVARVLGTSYDYEAEVTYTPVYAAAGGLSDLEQIEAQLFDSSGAYTDVCAVYVDGRLAGYGEDEAQVTALLERLKAPYINENTIHVSFRETVELTAARLPSNEQVDLARLEAALTAYTVEELIYTVEKGDTFNAIAYSHEMTPAMLKELNPDVQVEKLFVGDQLTMQQAVPLLSVLTINNESYEMVLDSPVEYIDTDELYRGETKVKVQGEDGLARVNADVSYLNGMETARKVNSSETLTEPTATVLYRGTREKPKTASRGSYIWPVSGTLTSRYGYRYIFGSTSFHAGIDIGCPYGKAIKAADGGTVTFSGWQSGYGYLVIISHDNGDKTYYAHNSSLEVDQGDKVYQGQTIARAGSTGRSTGVHCHFEIRRGGSTVNPLNYLP